MDYLNKKISDMRFCSLDLETTGINPVLHRIVEVGMIRFSLDGIESEFERLVDPGIAIPSEVTSIHGITNEMVVGEPKIGELLKQIASFIGDSVLVIQNPDFDSAFLLRAFRENGIASPCLDSLDTVRLARRTLPCLSNYRLSTVSANLGVPGGTHRALADARACMGVFLGIMHLLDRNGEWTMRELVRYHGRLVRPRPVSYGRSDSPPMVGLYIGKNSSITYKDTSGTITQRTIQPREFIFYGKRKYVRAFCFLRNEERVFRAECIVQVT